MPLCSLHGIIPPLKVVSCTGLYRRAVAPLGQCGGGTEGASPYFGTAGAPAGHDAQEEVSCDQQILKAQLRNRVFTPLLQTYTIRQVSLSYSPALCRYLSEKKQSSNEGPLKSYALGDNALDEIPPNEIKEFVEGVCAAKRCIVHFAGSLACD